jgi:type IV secretory pathway VirB2 component (pilin)
MKKFMAILWGFLVVFPFVFAEANVGDIVAPITRIYDLIKGIISVVAIIAITVAGARFMFSGDNVQAREASKSMLTYCIVGLVIVWVAPLLVGYLTAAPTP